MALDEKYLEEQLAAIRQHMERIDQRQQAIHSEENRAAPRADETRITSPQAPSRIDSFNAYILAAMFAIPTTLLTGALLAIAFSSRF